MFWAHAVKLVVSHVVDFKIVGIYVAVIFFHGVVVVIVCFLACLFLLLCWSSLCSLLFPCCYIHDDDSVVVLAIDDGIVGVVVFKDDVSRCFLCVCVGLVVLLVVSLFLVVWMLILLVACRISFYRISVVICQSLVMQF